MSTERRKLRERRVAPRDSNDRRKRHEARLRLSDGESDGWLVFESVDGKRRLRPIPREWHLGVGRVGPPGAAHSVVMFWRVKTDGAGAVTSVEYAQQVE